MTLLIAKDFIVIRIAIIINFFIKNCLFSKMSERRPIEVKTSFARIHGKLRSSASGSLDAWHLSQFFSSRPSLSLGFVQDQPPFDRVVAVPSEPTLTLIFLSFSLVLGFNLSVLWLLRPQKQEHR
jgi:hypothetical protein